MDGPVSILRVAGQPLLDGIEEAQDHWKSPEIFDQPKEGNARRVGLLENKLDPLVLQEGEGVIC